VSSAEQPTIVPTRPPSLGAASDRDTLASADTLAPVDAAAPLARGTAVGRYVVLEELGAGAMGRVYAAYDPVLDRRIALKILRVDPRIDRRGRARERMLREAQALAKLAHPNVVAVHDVEAHDDGVAIAMEFVDGVDARKWLRAEQHSWREVVDLYRAAAAGLAAAHAAVIVHRDFKPDNVMIGKDGRVRVVDFGLARADEPTSDASEASGHIRADTTATRGITGTPAYMAPEQHAGGPGGQASDQFALCVSLFEGLWDLRPFDGDSLVSLSHAVLEGRMQPIPSGSDVPGFVRHVVLRGLATEPGERFADMNALIDALGRDPSRTRRRIALALVGFAMLGGLGWLAISREPAAAPCRDAVDRIAGVWDDGVRTRVDDAFVASALPYARRAADDTRARLDAWAQRWTTAWTASCEDTRVHGTQSERVLDLRSACLLARRGELAAVTDLLARADVQVVERADRVVGALVDPERCGDVEALLAEVEPPSDPAVRAEVETLDREVAAVHALMEAAKYEEALEASRTLEPRAQATAYVPAISRLSLEKGVLEDKLGDSKSAELSLADALFAAIRGRDDRTAARAASELVYVVGAQLERIDEGLAWARHAEAYVDRLGDPLARARLLNNRALVLSDARRFAEAEADLRTALELRERHLGVDHFEVATTLGNLGIMIEEQARWDEAVAVYERALATMERALGPQHPRVAVQLTNLCELLGRTGQGRRGVELGERALAIFRAALPPDHPHIRSALLNLAAASYEAGDFPRSLEHSRAALEHAERTLGPDHSEVAVAAHDVGAISYKLQDFATARTYLERSIAIWETIDPNHPELADALLNLGILVGEEGDHTQAVEHLRRSLAIHRAAFPAEHPTRADIERELAEAERSVLR
jgi:tetratricopeptide (TPR) repeat protein/tRNA A-37 threonylcarbamoyl transferase component Bud32